MNNNQIKNMRKLISTVMYKKLRSHNFCLYNKKNTELKIDDLLEPTGEVGSQMSPRNMERRAYLEPKLPDTETLDCNMD